MEKFKNGYHFININTFSECQQKRNISIGHYEKIQKWLPFHKYLTYKKISNYWPPRVWVSGFLSVNGNGISAPAIMKKIEKWLPFCKYWLYWKISNYWLPPLKFGSLVFWVSMETEYQHQPLWKNWKMAAIS